MTSSDKRTFRFADWTATDSEIVRSWLAYKNLQSRNKLGPLLDGDGRIERNLSRRGWKRSWLFFPPIFPPSKAYITERMADNPYDFCIAYDAGVDIGDPHHGGNINPKRLPEILAGVDGHSNLDALFTATEEAAALRLLHTAIDNEKRQAEEKRAAEADAQAKEAARQLEYKIAPFFFAAPWRALTTTYGIAKGEVYIDKAILGIKFGSRPRMRIGNVTRTHPTGTMWGNVVFGESSGEPVVWEKVFRPGAVRQKIEEIIKAGQDKDGGTRDSP